MRYVYLQTIPYTKRMAIPFRIISCSEEDDMALEIFNIRPQVALPKKSYQLLGLDRLEVLAGVPFCDVADELIGLFEHSQLVFSENEQFRVLTSLFKSIGYNFNAIPKYVWGKGEASNKNVASLKSLIITKYNEPSLEFATTFIRAMSATAEKKASELALCKTLEVKRHNHDLWNYKAAAGVYFFLSEDDTVIYVGKAKNIRKRLQSHFSNQTIKSNIAYSQVVSINVVYTGNDIIAQLVETENIKALKPLFNTQQVKDPAPFIINVAKTAKGILKLQIVRKEVADSMPERYFNRVSVLKSLKTFCILNNLCRKHCGLEKVKGPCSLVTKESKACVCAADETLEVYNARFQVAFEIFQKRKERKIYKLKGRSESEDSFIYMVNGIYEGYGYIEKDENILNENELLSKLIFQENNYETTRTLALLEKNIRKEHILQL